MEKKRLSEQELVKILMQKQDELSKLNDQKEHLESLNEDAERIIEEQRERELPEEIEDTEALEHFLGSQYPDAYQQYKKYGKVVCPICKEEFKNFEDFVNHWQSKHLDKYGAYQPQQKTSLEEAKKELTKEESLKLFFERKRTKRKEKKVSP